VLAGPVLVHLAVRVDLDGLPRSPDLEARHEDDVIALGVVARARRRGEGHPRRRAGGGAYQHVEQPVTEVGIRSRAAPPPTVGPLHTAIMSSAERPSADHSPDGAVT
jgi:hypothetical protein